MEIAKYLTPLALAVWLMTQVKFVDGVAELRTYAQTRQDIDKLVNMLNNRYGLICSIYVRKNGYYRIILPKESVELVQTIVSPLKLPNLNLKIGDYKFTKVNNNNYNTQSVDYFHYPSYVITVIK